MEFSYGHKPINKKTVLCMTIITIEYYYGILKYTIYSIINENPAYRF